MTSAGPLTWRTGGGWLVLGGGGRWERGETGVVDAAVLGWADSDRPMAILTAEGHGSASLEALLDYYADLGGAAGYIVRLLTAADAHRPDTYELLAQAGLVYVVDTPDAQRLVRVLHGSPALDALGMAFEDGATVIAQGSAATALGAWVASDEHPGSDERGLEWVLNVILEPAFSATASAHRLRQLLVAHPDCLGVGIPLCSALALGPDGRVETIGPEQITVVLGPRVAAVGGADDGP
jgi:cyanophycinase-like exopeptidase